MSVRLRKVVRDLWLQRGRAGLVVMAMALGVFGVVWISSSSSVLSRELEAQYLASDPPSAIIVGTGITPELTTEVRALAGVAAAGTASMTNVRIKVGPSDYLPLRLFSRTDFTANTVAKLTPQAGAWPPPDGEIVIERAALGVAKAHLGGTIDVMVPGERAHPLRVAGTVHDLGQAPAWQEGVVYGYVSAATLTGLGLPAEPTELRIVVDGDRLDPDHIDEVARDATSVLRRGGADVDRVIVPVPGEHPHQNQMDSLLWLQQAFGVLALVLSGLLVAALMSALLAGQARQIGALKAVGGRTTQIAAAYAIMVTLLAGLALAIGWPLGSVAARGYVALVSTILNFDVRAATLSPWVILAQVAAGLAVPLSAAAVPVLRATRRTAAQAMADYGVSAPDAAGKPARGRTAEPRRPGAALMALRNTIRRRSRLAITMIALSIGGATFVAALNLSTSLSSTMDGQADELRYDVAVTLDRLYPSAEAAQLARRTAGVAAVEAWLSSPVTVENDAPVTPSVPTLYGVPADTTMLELPVLSGRWLRPGDEHGVVVSHSFAEDFPAARPGADIQLNIGGTTTTWRVVGVVRQLAAPPAAWVAYGDLAEAMGAGAATNALRVLAVDKDRDSLTATRRSLDDTLTAGGITIVDIRNVVEAQQVLRDHILVIILFFGLMTLLSVVIGGIGLATTMTINVIERTREIGVLRAVGASTRTVLALVVIEGGLIGACSWLVAVVLSLPVSLAFGRVLGEIFLETPLQYATNVTAPFAWLGIVVLLAALASLAPARRAAALTVRDTLTYQ